MRANVICLLFLVLTGCATPKYALHSVYKLTSCGQEVTRPKVTHELVRRGYLHSSEIQGPYDVFHKPEIVQKGKLAVEKFEDRSGDIAVAVCGAGSENYLLTEEWTHCKDRKDCTAENQAEVRKLAEDWGCQVNERSGHSESWKLESHQDWNKESCTFIISKLTF